MACETCVVRNRAICAVLNTEELAMLNRVGRQRNVAAGQSLIWEGDDSLMVANVIEGVFKLATSTNAGREQIVGIVSQSDFIGRPFGAHSQSTVTALTDARVCVFMRSDFDAFAREHPELEHKLLQRTLAELDHARRWMLLLGQKSATERIASFLLEMSIKFADQTCAAAAKASDTFTLPFGRQQVGEILGLTIETVSRQLAQLKADLVIDLPTRRDITILDRPRLTSIAG